MCLRLQVHSKTVKRKPPTRMKARLRGDSMRNLAGGLMGIIIGSFSLVALAGLSPTQPAYPEPFNALWFMLDGSGALQSTFQGLFNLSSAGAYLISWVIVGIVIAPFSKKGWNTLRSIVWAGVFLAIFALISRVLQNPSFWDVNLNPMRNYDLVYQFAMSIVVSLFAMISAIPITASIEKVRKPSEPPLPVKIETLCKCGAIFKSNPLICSECGSVLRDIED